MGGRSSATATNWLSKHAATDGEEFHEAGSIFRGGDSRRIHRRPRQWLRLDHHGRVDRLRERFDETLFTAGARITGMKLERCETLPKSGIVMLSYSIPPGE